MTIPYPEKCQVCGIEHHSDHQERVKREVDNMTFLAMFEALEERVRLLEIKTCEAQEFCLTHYMYHD